MSEITAADKPVERKPYVAPELVVLQGKDTESGKTVVSPGEGTTHVLGASYAS